MVHSFDVDIAKEYGILEAVLLNYLHFWIEKNKANGRHEHDGKTWTYNSIKAFGELFPYAKPAQIRRALKKLEDEKLIVTGNYNPSAYDRTMWYALTEKANSILIFHNFHLSKSENGNSENETPIPVVEPCAKPVDNQKEKKAPRKAASLSLPSADDLRERYGERLGETIARWIRYRGEIHKPFKSQTGLDAFFREVDKYLKGIGADKVIETFEKSMANNWQGLFYPPLPEESKKDVHSWNGNNVQTVQAAENDTNNPFARLAREKGII